MLISMTGFGRGEAQHPYGKFVVEVHSVNRKHLELAVNLPKNFLALDPQMRSTVGRSISRGRVQVQVEFERPKGHRGRVVLDEALAQKYLTTYQRLKGKLDLSGEVDLSLLVHSPDVVRYEEVELELEEAWAKISAALKEALKALLQMRRSEGRVLTLDIRKRLQGIAQAVGRIQKLAPKTVKDYEDQLLKKVREADKNASKEEELIQKEIAIFADRIDVTEELTRLGSHIQQFQELLRRVEPVGRTLDFLVQEMLREANTVGSKANNVHIAKEVVFLKSELEKIREQAQNVE